LNNIAGILVPGISLRNDFSTSLGKKAIERKDTRSIEQNKVGE
jgi:hypothetical protein